MNVKTWARYIHTIRYLRIRQIIYRAYYACFRMNLKHVKMQQPRQWKQVGTWPCAYKSCLTQRNQFCCLGEEGDLNDPAIWCDQAHSKLWLYSLHYLNELNSHDARGEQASQDFSLRKKRLNQLIENWMSHNPPGKGVGWEPYPLSLRSVNLVKWDSMNHDALNPASLINLNLHGYALTQQIEHHILGNHVFVNAKALIFIATYFEGPAATCWLKKGLKILDHELQEQFLDDGAHFELSPMYHASLLWDLCDLVNLANQSGIAELIQRKPSWELLIQRALNWLQTMQHPDGGISFFNDAAFGISPEFSDIKNYAEQLGVTIAEEEDRFALKWLKDSGYCVVNLGGCSKAIVDIGKIGPDYQPGHAHADTLSFELSLDKQRFLVNSGISQYGENALRQYQRSTQAHNTICINGSSSSDTWAGFRVARRAYPKNVSVDEQPNKITIGCAHDGYVRLLKRPIHRREWDFEKNRLVVRDAISGRFNVAEARYYFHPDVDVRGVDEDSIECYLVSGGKITMKITGAIHWRIEPSYWYPEFGSAIANQCLVIKPGDDELCTDIHWES